MTLSVFFAAHPKAALAYSGGTDSAYLLYAALKAGADIRPYYICSQFQPDFERQDALRLGAELGAEPVVIELDVLSCPGIAENPPERCYLCKKRIMGAIKNAAACDGYEILLDGTNASDAAEDRPGMRVLSEEGVLSPLRLCGLTKPEIRALSHGAGLFTAYKPAYACLATRIPAGEVITREKLRRIEKSEDILARMGFSDFRARLRGGRALLQFTGEDLPRAERELPELKKALAAYFDEISIDPIERRKSL